MQVSTNRFTQTQGIQNPLKQRATKEEASAPKESFTFSNAEETQESGFFSKLASKAKKSLPYVAGALGAAAGAAVGAVGGAVGGAAGAVAGIALGAAAGVGVIAGSFMALAEAEPILALALLVVAGTAGVVLAPSILIPAGAAGMAIGTGLGAAGGIAGAAVCGSGGALIGAGLGKGIQEAIS